jgi:hypothetical protein
VLEELEVHRLWMHRPWHHAEDIRHLFQSGRISDRSLRASLREALQNAHDLEVIAQRKGIPISEPFSDASMGYRGIHVLGPSKRFYQNLLPHFRESPEPKLQMGVIGAIFNVAEGAVKWFAEGWNIETLADPEDDENWRSAENNSSVILLIELGNGNGALFTADAAVPALCGAVDKAQTLGSTSPRSSSLSKFPIMASSTTSVLRSWIASWVPGERTALSQRPPLSLPRRKALPAIPRRK